MNMPSMNTDKPEGKPVVEQAVIAMEQSCAGSGSAIAVRDLVRMPGFVVDKTDALRKVLAVAARAYRARRPENLDRFLGNPTCLPYVGAFVGDPDMGRWPFDDPLRISDEAAVSWLGAVAYAAVVTDAMRRFVEVMFNSRRHETWVPASRAFARLSLTDAASCERLERLWAAGIPDASLVQWPDVDRCRLDDVGVGKKHQIHVLRHLMHAACCHLAEDGSGRFPGLTIDEFASLPLPRDDSSASVLLLCWLAVLAQPSKRAAVLNRLPARIREIAANELSEEVLRGIAALLWPLRLESPSAGTAAEAVRARLIEPAWQRDRGDKRCDTLWSWLDTTRWFKARGDVFALREMRDKAGKAGPALALCLDGTLPDRAPDAVSALLPRLRILLDPDAWCTTPSAIRSTMLGETLLLLDHPDVQPMDWDTLVRRAVGRHSGGDGPPTTGACSSTVSRAARAGLSAALARAGSPVTCLLRDVIIDEPLVLSLAHEPEDPTAGSGDAPRRPPRQGGRGFLSRQLAVQIERLLREKPPAEQVKFLWNLLQRDPHQELFAQLAVVLRGAETPLHRLVAGIEATDLVRDRRRPRERLADSYRLQVEAACDLLEADSRKVSGANAGSKGHEARLFGAVKTMAEQLHALVADVSKHGMADGEDLDSSAARTMSRLRSVLLGEPGETGLREWLAWLGTPTPELGDAIEDARTALDAAVGSGDAISREQCGRVVLAEQRLRRAIAVAAWPEREIVGYVLDSLVAWTRWAAVRAERSERYDEEVRRLLAEGHEESVLAWLNSHASAPEPGSKGISVPAVLDPAWANALPARTVRDLHRFLLTRMRHAEASKLRRCAMPRVELPARWAHLMPLLMGVLGGPILILDMGTAWDDIVAGHDVQYFSTVAVAFLASLVALALNLQGQAGVAGWRAWLRYLPRVGRLFAIATALAGISSLLVMLSLAGTSTVQAADGFGRQFLLWTALSVFLGIFVQLILQGRGVVRQD